MFSKSEEFLLSIIHESLILLYYFDTKYFKCGKLLDELKFKKKTATYNVVLNEYNVLVFAKHSLMFVNFLLIKPGHVAQTCSEYEDNIHKYLKKIISMDKTTMLIRPPLGESGLLASLITTEETLYGAIKKSKNKEVDHKASQCYHMLHELISCAEVALTNLNTLGLGHAEMATVFNEISDYIDNECKTNDVQGIISEFYHYFKIAA